jgi:hypothetical protein
MFLKCHFQQRYFYDDGCLNSAFGVTPQPEKTSTKLQIRRWFSPGKKFE